MTKLRGKPRRAGAKGAVSAPDKRRARAAAPARAGRKAPRSFDKTILALVYDFDGTLSPKPMQEYTFLPAIGEDPKAFWTEANARARREKADSLITYMHLMYRKAKERGIRIDREQLVALGRDVELFAGVATWFDTIGG